MTDILLIGYPNVGKSRLFNRWVSRSKALEGNWSGVTVNAQVGSHGNYRVVDLPGITDIELPEAYQAPDEALTLDYLHREGQKILVNVVDMDQISSQWYLTLSLMELGHPMLVILNVPKRYPLDAPCIEALKRAFPVSILPVHLHKSSTVPVDFSSITPVSHCPWRVEGDELARANARYAYIDQHLPPLQTPVSRLDRCALHPVGGVVMAVLVLLTWFFISIQGGRFLQDQWEMPLRQLLVAPWVSETHPWWSLILQGVGEGLVTTLLFVPVLWLFFWGFSFLEGSGYLSRISFLASSLLHRFHLPGQAVVPLILGFGCNVPAILSTRHLGSASARARVALMVPFMACSARLAIFTVFGSIFFGSMGHWVVLGLYLLGVLVALLVNGALSWWFGENEPAVFAEVLPVYRLPSPMSVCLRAWRRTQSFLQRAVRWIVPVAASLVVLSHVDHRLQVVPVGQSVLAKGGKLLTPWFAPMGLRQENWPEAVSLVTGVVAKEVVLGSLNTLHGTLDSRRHVGFGQELEAPSKASLAQAFATPQAALAYLVFILLYVPCISTIGAIASELTPQVALWSLMGNTLLAYLVACMVYQPLWLLGLLALLGIGIGGSMWHVARENA